MTGLAIQLTPAAKNRSSSLAVWPLERVVFWMLPFLVVFVNSSDFRGDVGEEFSVHWQIYLRLAVCGACGFFGGLYLFPTTYREFLRWPCLLLSLEVALYGISQITSVQPSYTMVAWLCYACVVLMVPVSMRLLQAGHYLTSLLSGLVLYLIGSWIVFWLLPAIGVHHEFTSTTDYVERMGGLGHPNELGFISAYAVILACGMAKTGRLRPSLAMIIGILGAATLWTCYSRIAIASCLIGLVVVFQSDWRRLGNAGFLCLLGIFGSLAVYLVAGTANLDWLLRDTLLSISRSGNLDELTTATGRTEIWSAAVSLIAKSPFVGYGYSSVRFILEDYSFHAHNIVLNAMLYCGLMGGVLIVAMMGVLLRGIIFNPQPVIDGLAACMLFGGMVEGLLGAAAPAASVMIWITVLLWRQMKMDAGA